MNKLNVFLVVVLVLAPPAHALRVELDQTSENISNGVNNTYSSVSLSQTTNETTLIGNYTASNIGGKSDATVYLGVYRNVNAQLYVYLNAGFSPAARAVPGLMLEGELGRNVTEALTLVGYARAQDYAGYSIYTFSPGLDYYFAPPAWLAGRYYYSLSSNMTSTNSWYLKYYQLYLEAQLKTYLGLGSGDQLGNARNLTAANYSSFSLLAGLQYKFAASTGIILDYLNEKRDNGLVDGLWNIGFFAEW